MSETVAAFRLDRLESDVHGMKASLDRLEVGFARLEATLTATLPHLATKADVATDIGKLRADVTTDIGKLRADLADKPGKAFLTGAIGVLLAAYALGLAGVAALPVLRTLLHIGG